MRGHQNGIDVYKRQKQFRFTPCFSPISERTPYTERRSVDHETIQHTAPQPGLSLIHIFNLFTLERTIDYVNENLTVVSIGGELVPALRLI